MKKVALESVSKVADVYDSKLYKLEEKQELLLDKAVFFLTYHCFYFKMELHESNSV